MFDHSCCYNSLEETPGLSRKLVLCLPDRLKDFETVINGNVFKIEIADYGIALATAVMELSY